MTNSDFWDFVNSIDFDRPTAEVKAEIVLETSPARVKRVDNKARELEHKLRHTALDHDSKPDYVSEEVMAETAGAVIAKGRDRYEEVLEDPELFWNEEYENWGESPIFTSYIPYRSEYAKVTDAYYRQRAKNIAKDYGAVADNEKYAEDYRRKAATVFSMLEEGVPALAGRSRKNDHSDDDIDYTPELMAEYAEDLEDDVEPRHVKRLIRDFRLYRQGYYDA